MATESMKPAERAISSSRDRVLQERRAVTAAAPRRLASAAVVAAARTRAGM
ncbi:MAG: hypothetical protein WCJ30_23285 [Deltaproteobacteria bacterium]